MDPERRRAPRATVDGDGSNGVLRGAVAVAVRDISPAGLGLRLFSPLEPGGVYPLTAHLSGLSLATPIRITRCRCDAAEPGSPGEPAPAFEAGAQFLWRDEGDLSAVRRWLDRRAGGTS